MLFIDLHYHASNFLIRDAEGAQEDGYRGGKKERDVAKGEKIDS